MSEAERICRYLATVIPRDLYVNLSDPYIEGLIRLYLRNKGRQEGLSDKELDAALKERSIQTIVQEFLKEVKPNGSSSGRAASLLKIIELISSSNQTPKDTNQE